MNLLTGKMLILFLITGKLILIEFQLVGWQWMSLCHFRWSCSPAIQTAGCDQIR